VKQGQPPASTCRQVIGSMAARRQGLAGDWQVIGGLPAQLPGRKRRPPSRKEETEILESDRP
jgi:hypothetical protein